MSEEWPSALDQRISEGKAEAISQEEKEAADRFKVTYNELFGSKARRSAPNPGLLTPTKPLKKLANALGLTR